MTHSQTSVRCHPATGPLFTVAMPCFRARDTIATAVVSVLAQTERDFELIVIDDGGSDGSAAAAMAAAGTDRRVSLIRQDNAGPAAARNRGIAAGSGRLIAFLDSDDRWAPTCLARHRDHFARQPGLGVSFARVRFFDAAMARPGRVSANAGRLTLAHALGENPLCTTSNLVARRAVFDAAGGFDVAMTHAEDQEWVARVLAATDWRVDGLDDVLVDYRTSHSGLSADLDRMRAGWRAMVERLRALAPGRVSAAESQAAALFERYLCRRALRTGQPATRAARHLAAAFRHDPLALFAGGPRRTLLTSAGVLAAALLPRGWANTLVA